MSPETLNLLIGAAIGLFASLITSWFNNKYQWERDDQTRKWELEDRHSQRERELFDKRIAAAETNTNDILAAIQKNLAAITHFSYKSAEFATYFKAGTAFISNSGSTASALAYLTDEILIQEKASLFKINEEIISIMSSLLKGEVVDQLPERTTTLGSQAISHHMAIIKRLDSIASEYY